MLIFIQTEDFEKDIIQPAVATLTAVLKAAAHAESVRRVVITSSCESRSFPSPTNANH